MTEKIEEDFFENILGDTMSCFEIPTPAEFTWQQISFVNFCYDNLNGDITGFLSFEKISILKEQYLSWQNKLNPNFDWVDLSINKNANISAFSHNNDLRWNDLDSPMFQFLYFYTEEIGCKTYQDTLVDEFLGLEE